MSTAVQRLTLEDFRNAYGGDVKPRFEFWDGEAIQKAVPTKQHAKLQKVLANTFAELGFYSFTELTLRIDVRWEPIPDVAATREDFDDPYPTEPVNVVAEALSPQDAFSFIEAKCERYANLGVVDILVFDPLDRKIWKGEGALASLIRISTPQVRLESNQSLMDLPRLWSRFDSER